MALIIYPTTDSDSFISIADADTIITNNSLSSSDWLSLTDTVKEVYLRIATTRILNAVSTDSTNLDGYLDLDTYDASTSCLPRACSMMAVHDLTYGLSSEVNPNLGVITKEKVGDLEVEYAQPKAKSGRVTSPFPSSTIKCLNSYGANISGSSFYQATLERK